MGKQMVNQFGDERECFARHMGVWAVRPEWLRTAAEMVKVGAMPRKEENPTTKARRHEEEIHAEARRRGEDTGEGAGATRRKDHPQKGAEGTEAARGAREEEQAVVEPAYSIVSGVAVVPIVGTMMKGESKFGGTVNTLRVRKAVLQAGIDPEVDGIMLRIESPGGHVAGTHELGEVVAGSAKPVWAYIEDLGASAAYWVASQAQRVLANRIAEIGSIGVFAVVHDMSEAYQREGIKVHVISSGGVKGMGVRGTELPAEYLAELRGQIEAINEVFIETVARGRKMEMEKARGLADGRVHLAPKAMELGLVDGVMGIEEAVGQMAGMMARAKEVERAKRRLAGAR